MKNQKEYLSFKKAYIKDKELNSDNVYNFLNENQIKVIQKYYEVYTKFLFNKLVGSLRLEVSKEKAKKLIELKGEGVWEFAGMIDMMKRGAVTCELGHPLRYVYMAKNKENGEKLYFGARCVGDFFDLDSKSIQALTRVKEDMFLELKDMVAIKELNLYEEHYKYDCAEIGLILKSVGLEGLYKIKETNPLIPILCDFVQVSLPFPKSLLVEVLKFRSEFSKMLKDEEYLGIDLENLNILKNSKITLISNMFTYSESDILDLIEQGEMQNTKSDFYNFRNIDDLNIAISIWVCRNNRLLKAQEYFKNMGIHSSWLDIYKTMIEKRLYRENPKIYYSVEILLLFDLGISVEHNICTPKEYGYKGYSISVKALDMFDSLIDYMASKEFFMCIRDVNEIIESKQKAKEDKDKKNEDILSYLKKNLNDDKYSTIRGILGVKDIILKKGLSFDDMSEKQQNYVLSIYDLMQKIDNKNKVKENNENESVAFDKYVNNRYTLAEKPEILAKIQRLQEEVKDKLTERQIGILNSVMENKFVSDRQIYQIEKAFNSLILGIEDEEEKKNVILGRNTLGTKKWNLIERPDVKEKIIALQKLSDYSDIPYEIQNIFSNILKYNSASDAQIRTVENTYRRHFKG